MICACGCGKEFEPTRPGRRYASPECKEKARRSRSAPMWVTAEERECLDGLRTGRGPVVLACNSDSPRNRPARPQRTRYRPILTTGEVARMLRVSERTVRSWRRRGARFGPRWLRIGRLIRYLRSDVCRFLQRQRTRRRKVGRAAPNRRARQARPAMKREGGGFQDRRLSDG